MLGPATVIGNVAPGAARNYLDAFREGDALLGKYAVTTPLRLSHFVAQFLAETGGGTLLRENLNYTSGHRLLEIFGLGNHSAAVRSSELGGLLCNPPALAERVYGLGNPYKAHELGNTAPGMAFATRGGGVLQTTGGNAYRDIGTRMGIDLMADPDLIVDARYALEPALLAWRDGGLNAYADTNDQSAITRRINGGYNGAAERARWFEIVFPLFQADGTPAHVAAPWTDSVTHLQQDLNILGADPPLAVDGRAGPLTRAAVRLFQAHCGLDADGVVGPLTAAAIEMALAA